MESIELTAFYKGLKTKAPFFFSTKIEEMKRTPDATGVHPTYPTYPSVYVVNKPVYPL